MRKKSTLFLILVFLVISVISVILAVNFYNRKNAAEEKTVNKITVEEKAVEEAEEKAVEEEAEEKAVEEEAEEKAVEEEAEEKAVADEEVTKGKKDSTYNRNKTTIVDKPGVKDTQISDLGNEKAETEKENINKEFGLTEEQTDKIEEEVLTPQPAAKPAEKPQVPDVVVPEEPESEGIEEKTPKFEDSDFW